MVHRRPHKQLLALLLFLNPFGRAHITSLELREARSRRQKNPLTILGPGAPITNRGGSNRLALGPPRSSRQGYHPLAPPISWVMLKGGKQANRFSDSFFPSESVR